MSTHGSQPRSRHGAAYATSRDTHTSGGFDPTVGGMPMSIARDGEQNQLPDLAPGSVDGTIIAPWSVVAEHIVPSSIPITAFEASIRAPTAVDAFPELPNDLYPEGALVLFLPDGKLYRNYLGTWDRSLDFADLTVGKITADQIEGGSIGAVHIVSEGLTADVIRGGVLILRPTDDYTQGIRVEDATGNLLSSWGPNGMRITDPADPSRYVVLQSGVLAFTKNDGADGFPNAITPDGINASSVTFGSSPGGHNLILNSSFELADFVAAGSTYTFTDATQWAAANRVTALANITEGASLSMTPVGYA